MVLYKQCKGNKYCLEDPTCYLTKRRNVDLTAEHVGKRTCRGRRLDECASDKCMATRGPQRFCRKRTKRV